MLWTLSKVVNGTSLNLTIPEEGEGANNSGLLRALLNFAVTRHCEGPEEREHLGSLTVWVLQPQSWFMWANTG